MKKILLSLLMTISLTINSQNQQYGQYVVENSPSCKNGHDGSLTAINTNTLITTAYLWSTGETTQTISNLSPGPYQCKFKYSNAPNSAIFAIVNTFVDTVDFSLNVISNASCGISDGEIKVFTFTKGISSGGINPYFIFGTDTSIIKLNGITYKTLDSLTINTNSGTHSLTVARHINNNSLVCYDTLSFTMSTTRPPLPICLVTVNQTSSYNTLVWDKTNISAADSFCVYRETATNVFQKIATIPPDSISEYNDLSANPNVTSYTYVITVKDTCGNESVYSNSHSTIHLESNGNGNFYWTLYQIQNTPNPVNYYIIYRDNLGDGNFTPISSTIPGTNTTFTDINYAQYPNAKYYISVSWNISCSPSRSPGLSTTRSNIKSFSATTGINEYTANSVIIFPNPTTGIFQISENFKIANIYNSTGSLIFSSKEKTIDISGLGSGIYFVEVNNSFYKVIKN